MNQDRQESQEEIEKALILLQLTRLRFDSLPSPQIPHPGSVLHVEGRDHTALEPIDTIVRLHYERAVDNIERTFEMILDADEEKATAHTFSPYSLIRTGIESAAMAYWTVEPGDTPTRVHRCLQQSFKSAKERESLAKEFAPSQFIDAEKAMFAATVKKLNQLKGTVPSLSGTKLTSPPQYTEILKSVSEPSSSPSEGSYRLNSPFYAWKTSSGFIHGSHQIVRMLSDFRSLGDLGDGISTGEISPSFQLITSLMNTTVHLIERVGQRYIYLATHDHIGRPVPEWEPSMS